jgi:tRNA A58 N-methylase Trm61
VNSGQAEATIEQVFEALNARLKVAGTLVIYSCYIEPLLELIYKLRADPIEGQETRYLNVQLTEQMLREHEIIKERTHPIMKQSIGLFKGFILSAIKVFV